MYEIEQREFRSRLYLAQFLSKNGFKVLIFQHRILSLLALLGRPGILFLKSNPHQFDYSLSLLARRGFKIFLWQEEGIHSKYNLIESPVFSARSIAWIQKYFAWHPADADFAIRQGFDHRRVEVCGNTRMELVSKVDRVSRKSNDPLRLLVISNFDMSKMSYNFLDDRKMGEKAAQDSQDEFDLIKSVAPKNFELYQDLLNHPEISRYAVTYRPYFFEQNILTFPSHILLDTNSSVFDSFKNTDVVIHYGSTMGIEAAQVGILSVNLSAELSSIDTRILEFSMNFSVVEELFSLLDLFSKSPEKLNSAVISQTAACINSYEMDFRLSNQSMLILEALKDNRVFPVGNFIKFSRLKVIYLELKNLLGAVKGRLIGRSINRKAPRLKIDRILREHEALSLEAQLLRLKYFRRSVYISQ